MVASSTSSSIGPTAHLHGGLEPSGQTTTVVVDELGGTTTVVDFGGGGLLLLMHPPNNDEDRITATNNFILGASVRIDTRAIRHDV